MDVENYSGHGSFIDLPKKLFQMLACVGPYLFRNAILLQKVHCNVLVILFTLLLFNILITSYSSIKWLMLSIIPLFSLVIMSRFVGY